MNHCGLRAPVLSTLSCQLPSRNVVSWIQERSCPAITQRFTWYNFYLPVVIPEQLPKELKKISSSIAFYSMTGKAKKKNYSGITVCQIRSMVDFCCSSLTLKSTQIYLSLLFMLFLVWPICGWYVKELYFTQNTVWGAELDLDSCSQDIKNHGRTKMERHSFTVWLGINSLAPYLRGGGEVWGGATQLLSQHSEVQGRWSFYSWDKSSQVTHLENVLVCSQIHAV